MKRFCLVLSLIFLLSALSGCTAAKQQNNPHTLSVVATLFPQYDFAKNLAEDLAEVTLLLPPGSESHSYEPTPADMMAVQNADLFIYTGDAMEGWAKTLIESLDDGPTILDLSKGLSLKMHEHDHHHDVDPHIFTNPRMAIQMLQSVEDALCTLDPTNSNIYKSRGEAYRAELTALDREFRNAANSGKRNKLIFGGRFAFLYFTQEYDLSYEAAYSSCSSESEPAAADIAHIIDTVKNEQIPVVYYEELADPKTARLICEETGAKPLLLHSCHNISKEELTQGVTYLSLMKMNLEHLKEGLN